MAHSETPQGRDLEETQENARELFKKYRGLGLRLTDKHAKDVDFIDVRGTLGVADLFVLATARSDVHLKTLQEEALEYLRQNQADLLVLDMIMVPGIDGLETYQRALEINPKQKAIIVSGFSETDRVKETQKLGAGAYVRKPYVMETLGMAIRNELRR